MPLVIFAHRNKAAKENHFAFQMSEGKRMSYFNVRNDDEKTFGFFHIITAK